MQNPRAPRRLAKWLLLVGGSLVIVQFLLSMKYDTTNMRVLLSKSAASAKLGHIVIKEINPQEKLIAASQVNRDKDDVTTIKKPSIHEGHNGFQLAMKVKEMCNGTREKARAKSNKFFMAPRARLVYCPVEKVGTTFWRRVLYMLTAPNTSSYGNPYDVPIDNIFKGSRYYSQQAVVNKRAGSLLKDSSFTFMFVRNPYSRLFSVYVDKLVPPNPYYWGALGRKAISAFRKNATVKSRTSGYDVTFSEFVKHVIISEKTHRNIDEHFATAVESCTPCVNSFTYIGKMENFKEDAMFIFQKVGMNSTVATLTIHASNLSTDDAITDSIRSPYSWKQNILKTIPWDTALRRVWLKLQLRGIVGLEQKFPLTKPESEKVTVNEFINIAREAHKRSDPSQLKEQKIRSMKEAFDSIELDDLNAFRETFRRDFELFSYDDKPTMLFDRPKEARVPTVFSWDLNQM